MRRPGGLLLAAVAAVAALARAAAAADCNANGVDDALDLTPPEAGFATARTECLEEPPVDLAAADLDGDGDQDVAVARSFGITLLSNEGKGVLLQGRELPVGSDPVAVASADLDEDGDADLVTLNRSTRQADGTPVDGSISVLLNRDGGSLSQPRNHAAGIDPIALAMADLDGDADLDLAVANATSADVSVYLNDGGGILRPDVRVILGGHPGLESARGIAAGDFDGDGDGDLVTVRAGSPTLASLLLNDGAGGFPEIRDLGLDPGFPTAIAAADVEGDGDIDLFLGVFAGKVLLALNQGRGTFDARLVAAAGGQPNDLVVEDLDGDSDPDLAVVEDREGELSLHRNDGGRFQETARASVTGVTSSSAIAAADMSGDGLIDLVTCDPDTRTVVVVVPSTPKGMLIGPTGIALDEPEQLLVADIDRDGRPDLLAHGDPRAVVVWRNEGGGGFSAPAERATDPAPHTVMAPDLDGDGDLDVAVTTLRGLNVFENVENALPELPRRYALGDDLTLAVPADLDGDGDADIAAVAPALGGALILFNTGSAGFEKGPLVPTPNVQGALDVLAGDADGDGDNDIVLPNRGAWNGLTIDGAHVAILENRGGAFVASQRPLDSFPLDVASGDVDGDGLLDIVLSLAACRNCLPALDPSAIVLLGARDGGYQEERRFFTGSQPLWVLVEDLESDGAPDVVLSLQDAGEVAVVPNRGGGVFGPPAVHSIDFPAISIAALDADGDRDLDLVASTVASRASGPCRPVLQGALRLLPNDGRGSFGPPIVAEAPEALFSVTPADLDGDGLPEVAAFGEQGIIVFWNVTRPASSLDRNQNGVPDECEEIFRRGDATGDGRIDVSDPIRLLSHLHRGGPEPPCLDAADADDSGRLDLTDAVVILDHLFRRAPAPPPPGTAGAACGPDPAGGEPQDPLGCEESPPCG